MYIYIYSTYAYIYIDVQYIYSTYAYIYIDVQLHIHIQYHITHIDCVRWVPRLTS